MNTTPDFNFITPLYQTEKTAFKNGQKNMLEKVLELLKQKEEGLIINEEIESILKSFYSEFYGK